MKIINFSATPSIINQYLHEIRDETIQQDRMRFVTNIERIGSIIGYEISKELKYVPASAQTALGQAKTETLKTQPVIATILRAGLPFHNGFFQVFNKADGAFIAAYRQLGKGGAMETVIGYTACPKLDGRPLIIADTMIATGTTIVDTYNELMQYGVPSQIFIASILVSKPALAYIEAHLPGVVLYTAGIDDELNKDFLIVPGLGDAGDIIYGKKFKN